MLKSFSKQVLKFSAPACKLKSITEGLKSERNVFALTFHDVPKHQIDLCRDLLIELKKEYGFIDPRDFGSFIKGDMKLNGNRLLLTFDDGFISDYTIAQEILNPLQIKAIFFVPTGFIDAETPDEQALFIKENLCRCQASLQAEEMKSMTPGNLSELVANGHTIGAHTKNHFRISEIDDDGLLEDEIISSGDRIEEMLGVKVEHFAYPFGDIDSINKKALEVARSRYKYIYSGIRGANKCGMNPGTIRREPVTVSEGVKYNSFVASGGLSFYYWRARKRLDAIASDV